MPIDCNSRKIFLTMQKDNNPFLNINLNDLRAFKWTWMCFFFIFLIIECWTSPADNLSATLHHNVSVFQTVMNMTRFKYIFLIDNSKCTPTKIIEPQKRLTNTITHTFQPNALNIFTIRDQLFAGVVVVVAYNWCSEDTATKITLSHVVSTRDDWEASHIK